MKVWRPVQVHPSGSHAFTLLEVILALGIAIGILVIGLYFHSQATNLRAQLLRESDRIATIRLVMDRLTFEIRNAFAQPQYGFTGDATSLRFVTVQSPSRASGNAGSSTSSATVRTDLRFVTYGLGRSVEGTNDIVTGLTRTEQPLLERPSAPSAFAMVAPLDATNGPAIGPEPLTDSIRFLRIWYWDGYGWSATWDSDRLPRGIEITLGADLLAAEGSLADYPGDLFRRVIYLPTSREIDPLDLIDATQGSPSTVNAIP